MWFILTIWLQLWTQTHHLRFYAPTSQFKCSDDDDDDGGCCETVLWAELFGYRRVDQVAQFEQSIKLCIINTFWIEESDQCTYSPLILPEEYADLHMWPWSCLSAVDFLSAAICHSTLSTTSLMAFSSSVWTVWSTAWTGHERFCFMSSSICRREH